MTRSRVSLLDQVSTLQWQGPTKDFEAVCRHFLQRGQHAAYMFVRIDESDDHRQLASGVHQVAGFDTLAAEESLTPS